MLKRTPLYEMHVAAGARMVDFGGWEMPVNYGSQIEEHHAVRRHAGMFDVSHMRTVDIEGAASRAFLRHLIANDVDKLTAGKALYSCMLRADGGVLDDLIVYWLGADRYRAVVNAATAEKDLDWMHKVAHDERYPVSILPRRELAMIAVQGPQARPLLKEVLEGIDGDAAAVIDVLKPFSARMVDEFFIARTGYTGEDGCEVVLPADEVSELWRRLHAVSVEQCGLGARDTLRLEAGMNLYGQDMDETVSPLESGLAWTVDLKEPREFIGRAALERQQAAGNLRQLLGLKMTERGVLRAHQAVSTARGAGEITSGTFSPTLGCSIALARLPAGVAVGDTVEVDLRGKAVPAQVVKFPFVRNGKALV
ncbi:MAG: glycine cleavage system aminomethyltransferase GcvT [Burkholderiales bacterium]|jgi:aminomethyltransferase|nr:glycine cleavage system aminomethyltransferase GcvT [Burkholderiales bacterium]